MMEKKSVSIFQRPVWVVMFSLTAALAWGWAYPLIKLGFSEFGIEQSMTGSKILFAGIRFTLSAGYGLAIGGALLIVPGILMGGTLPHITSSGIVILLLLIGISSLGFTLYNKLISCNPVGKVAIFNSLIPAVGAITSCLCLNEPFYNKYFVAILLAMAGIFIINKGK